ncbi:MAG: hypothetical protein Ta2B_08470 [Termitinemataceae bacterium]|nr:MAG: hypothetical protein Ta2B_08470 [Termitinemataceae bacterium]
MRSVKNSKLFWYVLLGVGVALFFVNEFAHGATPPSNKAAQETMLNIVLEAFEAGVDIGAIDEDYGFNPFYEGVVSCYVCDFRGLNSSVTFILASGNHDGKNRIIMPVLCEGKLAERVTQMFEKKEEYRVRVVGKLGMSYLSHALNIKADHIEFRPRIA